jgi:hypothetical protein
VPSKEPHHHVDAATMAELDALDDGIDHGQIRGRYAPLNDTRIGLRLIRMNGVFGGYLSPHALISISAAADIRDSDRGRARTTCSSSPTPM